MNSVGWAILHGKGCTSLQIIPGPLNLIPELMLAYVHRGDSYRLIDDLDMTLADYKMALSLADSVERVYVLEQVVAELTQ